MVTEDDGYLYFKLWVGAQHPRSKKPLEVGSDVIQKVLDEAKADFEISMKDVVSETASQFASLLLEECREWPIFYGEAAREAVELYINQIGQKNNSIVTEETKKENL